MKSLVIIGSIIGGILLVSTYSNLIYAGHSKINTACYYKGYKLYGKIKVVDNFPDIKVQVVKNFPDLKVKKVDHFPNQCGKWQFVKSFPDIKIKFVKNFPDIKIKYVNNFPGLP